MNDLTLSLLMCLASAVAYAGAAIVQERVAEEQGPAFVPWRRPAWWGAVSLNGSGAVLHVLALAYGPLTLVQPLGALTIVFALPMAALLVGRKAGPTAWRGALMATVGLAGLLALTGSPGNGGPDATERTLLVIVTGATVCVLAGAALAAHRHPAVRGGLLAAAGGVAFGIASVFTKIVTQARAAVASSARSRTWRWSRCWRWADCSSPRRPTGEPAWPRRWPRSRWSTRSPPRRSGSRSSARGSGSARRAPYWP
ncbi:hypothetical protein ACFWG7_25185 [Streptomyces koyangensis]|uniref:hypothetical protein n=1 Tax=Streptomyces koyangensis TaxID=188770 RepID=UPI00364B4961